MNGIGGRTIEEAKIRMGYPEFWTWVRYRRKRGSLNLGMRVERSSALLAMLYANTHSKKGGFSIYDFMPHDEEPPESDLPPISLEQAMETWH